MSDDLDLVEGDESRADATSERRRRRRERTSESGGSGGGSRAASKMESEARAKLDKFFDRLVKMRRVRGDDELAEIIEEDADDMAQGFISLTEGFTVLRGPLLHALNFFLPLLAFNRVGRTILGRLLERRAQRRMEMEAEYAAAEMENNGGGATVPVQ
jgi:hypothetical protein